MAPSSAPPVMLAARCCHVGQGLVAWCHELWRRAHGAGQKLFLQNSKCEILLCKGLKHKKYERGSETCGGEVHADDVPRSGDKTARKGSTDVTLSGDKTRAEGARGATAGILLASRRSLQCPRAQCCHKLTEPEFEPSFTLVAAGCWTWNASSQVPCRFDYPCNTIR